MNTQAVVQQKTLEIESLSVPHSNVEPAEIFSFTPAWQPAPLPLDSVANKFFKRAVDIVVSAILIVVIMPWLLPLMFILIKLNSAGPVFFLQKRIKKDGEIFTCIKFRTMYLNDESDITATAENDKRITRIGSFLRRHHIDELPQLINVLIGDMSLIGPRPYMVNENLKFENLLPEFSKRKMVKPGLTGLAQSMGHYGYVVDEAQLKERMNLDMQYIESWSILLDLKIILRTFLLAIGLNIHS
jgi:putative colanic acid biosynthesis UDP-glucose lipid carrier transferase